MSDLTETFQNIGIAVSCISAFAAIIVRGPVMCDYRSDDPEQAPTLRKLSTTVKILFVTALLGWLVTPWICYGVYKVAKMSTNQIEYCERPPTVIPKNPETIDLNKVEKDSK